MADLIELCFYQQMDEDGREYLRHLRRVARQPDLLRWVQGAGERVSYPLNGFACEVDGQVVGNCSLIPYYHDGHWRYLIANVAVHPDHRRKGIARQLTQTAVRHIHDQGAEAWLQVRDDNPPAIQLYRELGFEEVTRRDMWLYKPGARVNDHLPAGVRLGRRQRSHWQHQSEWLSTAYPPEVIWNIPLRRESFKPSLLNILNQFLTDARVSHLVVYRELQLGGVGTLQGTNTFADWLWLAMDPTQEEATLPYLLTAFRGHSPTRHLAINYPAGRCRSVFESCGCEHMNCLIWMRMLNATKC